MRPLTDEETKTMFEKLSKYIGDNIKLLVDRPDGSYCFRLHNDRVYYMSEKILKLATHISRDKLVSVGTCFGKFTKTIKFRLHITALDFLAPYAKVGMGAACVVYGCCMCWVWVVYGCCMCWVCVVYGCCMCCVWVLHVLGMGCVWVLHVLGMGCVWVLHVLCMGAACVGYGLCMGAACVGYGLCMGVACVVYGCCMCWVWVVYGCCMCWVWVVYGFCMCLCCPHLHRLTANKVMDEHVLKSRVLFSRASFSIAVK
uniref:NIP7 nucleolar pre-rRNA processing protein n=1 Tax=Cyclopterus lumpus TaxID=8103 RepID=A0A8C2WKG6_CYCLU